MHFNRKIFFTGIVAAIIFASCAPALYKPVPDQATATVSYDELVKGRSLYVNSCGSCHSLYLPEQYHGDVWRHNVDEMQQRAKISDTDKELILSYLLNAPKK